MLNSVAQERLPAYLSAILTGIRRLAGGVMDIVVPPACAVCGIPVADAGQLCATCWTSIRFIEPPFCPASGRPLAWEGAESGPDTLPALLATPAWHVLRAVTLYDDDGPARLLVHRLKFGDDPRGADFMARSLWRAGRELLMPDDVLIVPVPLHRWRLWRRRYNQAAELSRRLARLAGRRHAPLVLQRRRATSPQARLSGSARRRNVRGAFTVPPERWSEVTGRPVVLVDDVLTTGATATACCQALSEAGARRVDVLVFALAGVDGALHK